MNSKMDFFDLATFTKESKNYHNVFTILGFDQKNISFFKNLVLKQIIKDNFHNFFRSDVERNISGEEKLPIKLFEITTSDQMYLIIECYLSDNWEKVLEKTLELPQAKAIFLVENLFKSENYNNQHMERPNLKSICEKNCNLHPHSKFFFISIHTTNTSIIGLKNSIKEWIFPGHNENNEERLMIIYKSTMDELYKTIVLSPNLSIENKSDSKNKQLGGNLIIMASVNDMIKHWKAESNKRKGVLKKLIDFIPKSNNLNLKKNFDKSYEQVKSIVYPEASNFLYYICKNNCGQKDCLIGDLSIGRSFEDFKKFVDGATVKCKICNCNEKDHLVISEKLIRNDKPDRQTPVDESKKNPVEEKKDAKNSQVISKNKDIPVLQKNEEEKKNLNPTSNSNAQNQNEKGAFNKNHNKVTYKLPWNKSITPIRSPQKISNSTQSTNPQPLKKAQPKDEKKNSSPNNPVANKPQSISSSITSKEPPSKTLPSNINQDLPENKNPNTLTPSYLTEYLCNTDHNKCLDLSNRIFIFIGDKSSGKTSMILSFINTLTCRNFKNPIEIKPNTQSQSDSSLLFTFTCPEGKKYTLIELKNNFDKDFPLSESERISELRKYCITGHCDKITIVLIQKACENIKNKWKTLLKVFKSFEAICIFTYFNNFDIEKSKLYKYFTMWEFIDNDAYFYESKDLVSNDLKIVDEKIWKIINGLKKNRENCREILEKFRIKEGGEDNFKLGIPLFELLGKLIIDSS